MPIPGCSAVWSRVRFGTVRPRVQISPLRPQGRICKRAAPANAKVRNAFMRMRTFALAKNAKHLQIRCSVIAAAPQSQKKKCGAIVMLRRWRSFRWAPFWRFNAAHRGTVSFLYASGKRTQAARAPKRKETPPLLAGVRCIGRSYRNRTYTMGVRGPCATTTPSSNA